MIKVVENGVMRVTQIVLKLLIWLCNFVLVLLALSGVGIALSSLFPDIANDLPKGVDAATFIGLTLAGIVIVFVLFLLLRKFIVYLRAIVDSVDDGDPFVIENAHRLRSMGWISIFAYPIAMSLAFVEWAMDKVEDPAAAFDVEAAVDVTGLLTILLLFILARVFEQGVAMREELEGTV